MSKKKKHINHNLPDNSNPFKTPEGYFDSFSERLMDRIEREEAKPKASRTRLNILRPALTLAASFVLIFFIIYFPVKYLGPKVAGESEISSFNDLGYMDYYILNDREIYEALAQDTVKHYDEAVLETYLMASVSDIELMELNN